MGTDDLIVTEVALDLNDPRSLNEAFRRGLRDFDKARDFCYWVARHPDTQASTLLAMADVCPEVIVMSPVIAKMWMSIRNDPRAGSSRVVILKAFHRYLSKTAGITDAEWAIEFSPHLGGRTPRLGFEVPDIVSPCSSMMNGSLKSIKEGNPADQAFSTVYKRMSSMMPDGLG